MKPSMTYGGRSDGPMRLLFAIAFLDTFFEQNWPAQVEKKNLTGGTQ